MRTLATILRTIGRSLSWPAQEYAAPWGRPRHCFYFHHYYLRYPGSSVERR
jgi:hypothetical protein